MRTKRRRCARALSMAGGRQGARPLRLRALPTRRQLLPRSISPIFPSRATPSRPYWRRRRKRKKRRVAAVCRRGRLPHPRLKPRLSHRLLRPSPPHLQPRPALSRAKSYPPRDRRHPSLRLRRPRLSRRGLPAVQSLPKRRLAPQSRVLPVRRLTRLSWSSQPLRRNLRPPHRRGRNLRAARKSPLSLRSQLLLLLLQHRLHPLRRSPQLQFPQSPRPSLLPPQLPSRRLPHRFP